MVLNCQLRSRRGRDSPLKGAGKPTQALPDGTSALPRCHNQGRGATRPAAPSTRPKGCKLVLNKPSAEKQQDAVGPVGSRACSGTLSRHRQRACSAALADGSWPCVSRDGQMRSPQAFSGQVPRGGEWGPQGIRKSHFTFSHPSESHLDDVKYGVSRSKACFLT